MPNWSAPREWLGNCCPQALMSTLSGPDITFPLAVRRESRPLTTQPSVFGPGGVGHPSFQTGAVPPIGAS